MALFGAWDDLSNFGQITDIRVFFHLADDVWDAVCMHLGQTGEHIRLLGAVPASAIPAACGLAVLPDGWMRQRNRQQTNSQLWPREPSPWTRPRMQTLQYGFHMRGRRPRTSSAECSRPYAMGPFYRENCLAQVHTWVGQPAGKSSEQRA